ncbi:hypothetical protein APHAL10511_000340 [Amanita phalloides]|nr:hypothetical protein APHAL10511_000340 [Amanita phalloides]
MFPSTPSSNAAPTPPTHLTRSRIPLAERIQKRIDQLQGKNDNYSPRKGKRDRSPATFGRERMVRAKSGHFRRPSLETSCLIARGEDVAHVLTPAVQDTPPSQQQVICTSSSPWGDSPSFASPDRASNPHFSRPGFALFQPDFSLANLESPLCKSARTQVRTPLHGHTVSSSISHETIDENVETAIVTLQVYSPDVFRARESPRAVLRKYYALKYEAERTVGESKKLWSDTPYSAFELQNFQPPCDVETIQSILQESMKNYQPLPSELRLHRRRSSRFYSRTSPYAHARISRLMTSPQKTAQSQSQSPSRKKTGGIVLEAISLPDALTNRESFAPHELKNPGAKPFTPFTADKVKTSAEAPKCSSPLNMRSAPRPVLSTVRPPMPGQSPSKTRSSIRRRSSKEAIATSRLTRHEQKNKENILQEAPKTPGSSLRTGRPRPRYRTPTPCPKRRLAKK